MEEAVIKAVEQTILRRSLLGGGEKVLAAVSGGADSLCLLHLLWRLREKYSLSLFVGHINHLMRGEQAAEDARFVEDFARGLGLTTEVVEVEVKALAKQRKLSIEDAGRQARYEALEDMAERIGAECIALGHTADDQVETILLNFLRGGGPEGLAGMPVSRELESGRRIIRPLIEMTKAETEAYCQEQGISPRLDATNLEMFARRNRIRHELLPALKKEQPALEKLLLRQAEIFRAEDEFLRGLAEKALEEVEILPPGRAGRRGDLPNNESQTSSAGVGTPALHNKEARRGRETPPYKTRMHGSLRRASPTESEVVLSIDKLNTLPAALARRVVREALRRLRKGRVPLAFEQIERVVGLAREGESGKRLDLGDGLWAEREYQRLIIRRGPPPSPSCFAEASQDKRLRRASRASRHGDLPYGQDSSAGVGTPALQTSRRLKSAATDSLPCRGRSPQRPAQREQPASVSASAGKRSALSVQGAATLAIPGEVEFGGVRLRAERVDRSGIADLRADEGGRIAFLDGEKSGEELMVRFPKAGDRFLPLGAPGEMKLQDFFVNLKVPRRERAKALLICRGEEIVWVVGYRIDDRFKVREETREVVRLEAIGREQPRMNAD